MKLHLGLMGGCHEITSHLASNSTFFTPNVSKIIRVGPPNPCTKYYHCCSIINFPADHSSVYYYMCVHIWSIIIVRPYYAVRGGGGGVAKLHATLRVGGHEIAHHILGSHSHLAIKFKEG